jgi:hypothetical protein
MDGVPCRGRKSRTAIQKCCACSRKSAFRDKGAANENPSRKEKFPPRFSLRNCTESGEGFARNLEKDLHGRWKDCRGEEVGVEERFSRRMWKLEGRISIKASRPLDVSSSFFSTLSDSLRESCVFVTELISLSPVSSLSLVTRYLLTRPRSLTRSCSPQRISHRHVLAVS